MWLPNLNSSISLSSLTVLSGKYEVSPKATIIPAHYEGPEHISLIHLFHRPVIRVMFGAPISTPSDAPSDKEVALRLTAQLDNAMNALVSTCSRYAQPFIPPDLREKLRRPISSRYHRQL